MKNAATVGSRCAPYKRPLTGFALLQREVGNTQANLAPFGVVKTATGRTYGYQHSRPSHPKLAFCVTILQNHAGELLDSRRTHRRKTANPLECGQPCQM